jgi:hypothetical protein
MISAEGFAPSWYWYIFGAISFLRQDQDLVSGDEAWSARCPTA